MNRQELDRELGQPAAGELLESARLGYNGSDGFPRVIPIGFHWNGEQIVICTATTAPKVRAISSRPQVAVTIDAGHTPSEAKSLQVRGTARIALRNPALVVPRMRASAAVPPRRSLGTRSERQVRRPPDARIDGAQQA